MCLFYWIVRSASYYLNSVILSIIIISLLVLLLILTIIKFIIFSLFSEFLFFLLFFILDFVSTGFFELCSLFMLFVDRFEFELVFWLEFGAFIVMVTDRTWLGWSLIWFLVSFEKVVLSRFCIEDALRLLGFRWFLGFAFNLRLLF